MNRIDKFHKSTNQNHFELQKLNRNFILKVCGAPARTRPFAPWIFRCIDVNCDLKSQK